MNRTARTATLSAAQRIALARTLAATRAHESRAALAILGGDHAEATVARFVKLGTDAARLAAQLA